MSGIRHIWGGSPFVIELYSDGTIGATGVAFELIQRLARVVLRQLGHVELQKAILALVLLLLLPFMTNPARVSRPARFQPRERRR